MKRTRLHRGTQLLAALACTAALAAPCSVHVASVTLPGALFLLPHAGVQLAGLAFTEQGSYRIDGCQSDVNVLGELAVAFAAPGLPAGSAAVTPAGYFFPNTGATESWSAAAALDFTAASAAQQAAGLTLILDQTLQAYTRATDTGVRLALIATSGALSMQVSVVPEVRSALMMALGLFVFSALRAQDAGRSRGQRAGAKTPH